MNQEHLKAEYKPNIYPIMYWALVYGVIAASALLIIKILADLINIVWFLVFLAGVVWGGFRKYKQDKAAWMHDNNVTGTSKTAQEEFKDAARDIAQAGKEMIAKQVQENAQAAEAVERENAPEANTAAGEIPVQANPVTVEQEEIITEEPEMPTEEEPKTPQSPLQPLV